MTLVEFLAPLKDAAHRDKCLAVTYFKRHYEAVDELTVDQISRALVDARLPKAKSMNVADVLSKSGEMVESPGARGRARLWRLTPTGEAHVRRILSLPEAYPEMEHSVSSLERLAGKIANPDIRDYIMESIKCLRFDGLRPAIVFLWAGAVTVLRNKS